jgi:hypothetical protein
LKKAGKMMLASGVLGFFFLFWYWIIPGILLTVAGVIALLNSRICYQK